MKWAEEEQRKEQKGKAEKFKKLQRRSEKVTANIGTKGVLRKFIL